MIKLNNMRINFNRQDDELYDLDKENEDKLEEVCPKCFANLWVNDNGTTFCFFCDRN